MALRILTVVGARPQFVKAAAIARAVAAHNEVGDCAGVNESQRLLDAYADLESGR